MLFSSHFLGLRCFELTHHQIHLTDDRLVFRNDLLGNTVREVASGDAVGGTREGVHEALMLVGIVVALYLLLLGGSDRRVGHRLVLDDGFLEAGQSLRDQSVFIAVRQMGNVDAKILAADLVHGADKVREPRRDALRQH